MSSAAHTTSSTSIIPSTHTLAWIAAGLATGASLLHWAAGENHTHQWALQDALLVVAATAQVLLAMLLVLAPWRGAGVRAPGLERTVYVAGAALNAAIVIALALSLLLAPPAGPHPTGHAVAEVETIGPLVILATAMEVILVGLLVWMARLPGRPAPARESGRDY